MTRKPKPVTVEHIAELALIRYRAKSAWENHPFTNDQKELARLLDAAIRATDELDNACAVFDAQTNSETTAASPRQAEGQQASA